MHINFHSLNLNLKKGIEAIDLNFQVIFFHGKVSSGKSSIAKLINFCLGGSLEKTIAIQKELVSVSLELSVGTYKVLLERNASNNTTVIATCVDQQSNSFTINVPVATSQSAVWADKVYNLSDLIFYLLDLNVLRIPSNKKEDNVSLVRLSFRNFMWYCYIDQSKFDNSFFRHEDSTKSRNSKETLKYIMQYSTQKLLDLEEKLRSKRKDRFGKQATAAGLRDFLKKFNFSSEEEIAQLENSIKAKLKSATIRKSEFENDYSNNTHFADILRNRLRVLRSDIQILEDGITDLENRISQQQSLKSELVSSKFKIAKSTAIATVFQGVEFTHCPECGTSILARQMDKDSCKLCTSPKEVQKPILIEQSEVIQIDLNERIKDIESSIDLHKKSLIRSKKQLTAKKSLRITLDQDLQKSLQQYESVFLSNIRAIDNEVSTLRERLKSVKRLKIMPQEINKLEDEALEILKEERNIKQQIESERGNFLKGETLITEVEKEFHNTLIRVGMPGVSSEDKVNINRNNWDVTILPAGEEYLKWNFYNAGSGGKKTLFNSCFLLALHIVASKNNLSLPSFIIIDTPMKNIDKEVNHDIFKSFYDYLYEIATTILERTQIIIIDNNYIPPKSGLKITFKDRYMESGDINNPPLIPYYNGA